MSKTTKLYEGKAKILYSTDDPKILLSVYKDDATAFNAQKKGTIEGKGEINCTIASALFQSLETAGIPTHYIDNPTPDRMRVKAVTIIPIEVVVRNIAAGSLCRQTGITEGTVLDKPLVEYYLKDDNLGDPLLTRDRLFLLDIVTQEQLGAIEEMALKINYHLQEFFKRCQITLVDFKLEFGFDQRSEQAPSLYGGVISDSQQQIILADEISPDTCRLWDATETDPNARVMDKDRFRKDLGRVESAYSQVKERVLAVINSEDGQKL